MAYFKLAIVMVVIASAQDSSDDVTLLQSQVQEKATKPDVDIGIEHGDEYNLKQSLKCATEKTVPELAASFAEPSAVPERHPMTATSTSSDPPGSGALKAVYYLMILCLLVDGIRRWNVQQKQDSKEHQVADKKLADNEAAAEAAWVDMVNAAASGDVNSFEMALNHKPRVMKADTWGCTPLHFSAVGGSVAIATELLKQGVDVDALDACEETPLHFAARAGQGPMCELLLGAGAKMDPVNERGFTPLVLAGQADARAACRLLVNHGAGVAGLADEELPPLVVSELVQKIFAAVQ